MWPRTGVIFGKCGIGPLDSFNEWVCRSNGSSNVVEHLTLSSVVDGVNPSCWDDSGLFVCCCLLVPCSSSTRDGTLEARFSICFEWEHIANGLVLKLNGLWGGRGFEKRIYGVEGKLTFLLGLGSIFEGVDGSKTGLVFRLFENFFRFRFSAANAPNPKRREHFKRKKKQGENRPPLLN